MSSFLTRQETAIMKGYAILCILIHNLLHLAGPLVKENEFYYNFNHRAFWMKNHLLNLHPNLLGDLFSFFGWYGVPVFIFLSGYGITKKYEPSSPLAFRQRWQGFTPFWVYNFRKLVLLMAPAYLLYLLIGICILDKDFSWSTIFQQFTLIVNFWGGPAEIDPGVYWYFGLTLQLYLVYRVVFYAQSKGLFLFLWIAVLSISFCWLVFSLPDPMQKIQPYFEYISHNCVRWLLPFLLGVLLARFDKPSVSLRGNWLIWLIGWLFGLLFIVGTSFHQIVWLFSPMGAVIASVCFAKLVPAGSWLGKLGSWLGGVSAFLFAIHPLVRPFFVPLIMPKGRLIMNGQDWGWVGCYLLVSLLAALFYQFISAKYIHKMCEILINKVQNTLIFKKNQ